MDTYQKNRNNSGESILDLAIGAVKRVAAWLAYWALVVYYALRSPALPWKDKAKIIAALAYLLLPFDILPDAIPVVFGRFAAVIGPNVQESPVRHASEFRLAFFRRSCPCHFPEPCIGSGKVQTASAVFQTPFNESLTIHLRIAAAQVLEPGPGKLIG